METNFQPNHLLQTYWNGFLPIDYSLIFKNMEIEIEEIDFDNETLAFIEKKKYEIKIFICKNYIHKNTLLAFVASKINAGLIDGGFSISKIDFNEKEANFHSQIAQNSLPMYLVPERLLLFIIQDTPKTQLNFKNISQLFNVSEPLLHNAFIKYNLLSS